MFGVELHGPHHLLVFQAPDAHLVQEARRARLVHVALHLGDHPLRRPKSRATLPNIIGGYLGQLAGVSGTVC